MFQVQYEQSFLNLQVEELLLQRGHALKRIEVIHFILVVIYISAKKGGKFK